MGPFALQVIFDEVNAKFHRLKQKVTIDCLVEKETVKEKQISEAIYGLLTSPKKRTDKFV